LKLPNLKRVEMKKMMRCLWVIFNFALATLVTLGAASAHAQAEAAKAGGTRYGVLSLIGDRFYTVTKQSPTANQPQSFQRIDLVMPTPAFDEFVLKTIDGLIKRAEPDASVSLMAVTEPKLYMSQTNLIDSGAALTGLLPGIREITANAAIDKLILVTKFPDQAHAKMGKGSAAAGSFFGLGFYSDDPASAAPSAAAAKGANKAASKATAAPAFVAPYVYIQVLLIDVKSWSVQKQTTTAAATTRVIARAKDAGANVPAYDSMSGQDKVETISKMLDYELSTMLPKLLAK
jgi:hypothetical protein